MAKLWKCPYCNGSFICTPSDLIQKSLYIERVYKQRDEGLIIDIIAIICPNEDCNQLSLKVVRSKFRGISRNTHLDSCIYENITFINEWQLLPESYAKVYPIYIPKVILDDYKEACAIVNLSPKSSATLARRCLQGIIRDYWKVQPDTLFNELKQIESKIPIDLMDAISAIRKIGNIGAHMEKDINLIIDVEPHEAEMLIQLIEMLFEEWYIARYERTERLNKIKQISKDKEDIKINNKS